jgi:ribose/xylose/arabinose/galactoside ABC-type transport system permease subunit
VSYGDQGYRFRDEPDYPSGAGYGGEDLAASPSETTGSLNRAVTAAELGDVFDDPEHGEPGMDRMVVHLLWELVLLAAAAGLAYWFRRSHPAGISGLALRDLLLTAAALGFVTVGMGLSMRAGAVNLALGPIAAAAGLFFGTHTNRGLVLTIAMTLALSAGIGALIGLAVALLHVPGWAASLAGAFGLIVWLQKQTGTTKVASAYHPDVHAYYWYGGFAALALVGGVLGLIKPVRRAVGRFRPVGDPAERRGTGAAVLTFLSIVASALLAGLAGVLMALTAGTVSSSDGLVTTGLALAAALVGGTSAYGRRGGVFGTLLAVSLLALIIKYGIAANLRISNLALAAGGILIGLMVTRMVETFGRPRSAIVEDVVSEEWVGPSRGAEATASSGASAWSTPSPSSGWTSQLPARSGDDAWGSTSDDRWGVR